MSTGGPDPNRMDEADPEVARGNLGDPSATRFGLSSGVIAFIALAIALGVIWVAAT